MVKHSFAGLRSKMPGLLGGNLYYTTNTINISPTLGPELLTNGDFSAWTGDAPDGWTVYNEDASNYITESAGGGEARVVSDGSGWIHVRQNGVLPHHDWARLEIECTDATSGSVVFRDAATKINQSISAVGTHIQTGMAGSSDVQIIRNAAPTDITVDNASVKKISDHTQVFTHPLWYGDFTINYNRSAYYQAGVYALYTDSDNYVLAYDDGRGKIGLIKTVSGTITEIGSWSHAYTADKDFTLRVHKDGTMDVIYNGVTLASGLADTGLRGKQGGVLLTDASEVTINSYTWDARSAT